MQFKFQFATLAVFITFDKQHKKMRQNLTKAKWTRNKKFLKPSVDNCMVSLYLSLLQEKLILLQDGTTINQADVPLKPPDDKVFYTRRRFLAKFYS